MITIDCVFELIDDLNLIWNGTRLSENTWQNKLWFFTSRITRRTTACRWLFSNRLILYLLAYSLLESINSTFKNVTSLMYIFRLLEQSLLWQLTNGFRQAQLIFRRLLYELFPVFMKLLLFLFLLKHVHNFEVGCFNPLEGPSFVRVNLDTFVSLEKTFNILSELFSFNVFFGM